MYNIIVTGSKDMSLRVWDLKTKHCLLIFNRHVSNVLTVHWNLAGMFYLFKNGLENFLEDKLIHEMKTISEWVEGEGHL